jgi:hypothetical protein
MIKVTVAEINVILAPTSHARQQKSHLDVQFRSIQVKQNMPVHTWAAIYVVDLLLTNCKLIRMATQDLLGVHWVLSCLIGSLWDLSFLSSMMIDVGEVNVCLFGYMNSEC